MSTGTRAARASTSRQVKQELVRLLFGHQMRRKGPESHRLLDYSIYSYDDLKKAYLGRVQELHPDKNHHHSSMSVSGSKEDFQQVQSAWDRYEELAKTMKQVGNGAIEEGSASHFTMFGVGCSFSDNDEERELRSKITDQACRGWFSSGELTASSSTAGSTENSKTSWDEGESKSLLDETMFLETAQQEGQEEDEQVVESKNQQYKPRRTLIPGIN